MKNHRNIDVWLERACHLTVVGLSVTAAFLLRFDFTHPRQRNPHSEASAADRDSGEVADLRLGRASTAVCGDSSASRTCTWCFWGIWPAPCCSLRSSMFWIGPAMPRSVLIIDAVLCFVATALVRFSVRICNEAFRERSGQQRTGILIYGAGAAGAELVREIHSNRCTEYEVKGFLDDDPLKQDARIMGIPVLGSGREAFSVVRQLNRRKPTVGEIIIAMPSATGAADARGAGQLPRRAVSRARPFPASTSCSAAGSCSPRCATRRFRICSAGSRCAWTRLTCKRASPAVRCWSPAPPVRSARSCAARWRASSRRAWWHSIRRKATSSGSKTNSGKGTRNWSW